MRAFDIINEHIRTAIEHTIADAEKLTSGEIRVHVEDTCEIDPVDRAFFIFGDLKMHETKDRNGVLFYLSVVDHKFAIVGDEGIHQKVGSSFWEETKALVIDHLKKGEIEQGICQGLLHAGHALKTHFPRQHDDANELSNTVTFKHPRP